MNQCSVHETAKILHKEEAIKKMRRKILRKLEVSPMKAAIELYKKVAHNSIPTSSYFNDGTDKERVRFS